MQAIDFLRKGSYAPDIIKDHQTNVLCILHVGKNVRVKLEKKIIISCNFGTLLFYTLIYSNTTLRYMFAQGRMDERRPLLCHSVASRRRTKKVYGLKMGALRLSAFSILSVLRLSTFYLWFAWGI